MSTMSQKNFPALWTKNNTEETNLAIKNPLELGTILGPVDGSSSNAFYSLAYKGEIFQLFSPRSHTTTLDWRKTRESKGKRVKFFC